MTIRRLRTAGATRPSPHSPSCPTAGQGEILKQIRGQQRVQLLGGRPLGRAQTPVPTCSGGSRPGHFPSTWLCFRARLGAPREGRRRLPWHSHPPLNATSPPFREPQGQGEGCSELQGGRGRQPGPGRCCSRPLLCLGLRVAANLPRRLERDQRAEEVAGRVGDKGSSRSSCCCPVSP